MFDRLARRLWPLAAVAALLAGIALLSMISRPGLHQIPVPPGIRHQVQPTPPSESRPVGTKDPSAFNYHLPRWLADAVIYGIGVVFAVVVLGVIVFVISQFWSPARGRRADFHAVAVPMTRREAVLAAVAAGIADLARDDGDARSSIIACWVRLEQIAAAAGTERMAGESPSELVARLLHDHQVSANVLTSLAELYHSARYSSHTIDAAMRTQALAAFGRLRTELEQSRSGPLADDPVVDGAPIPRSSGPRSSTPRSSVPRSSTPPGGAR